MPLQASSGLHNNSLISVTVVTIHEIFLSKNIVFRFFFFNMGYLLRELRETQEVFFPDPCIPSYIFKATYKVTNLQKNNRNTGMPIDPHIALSQLNIIIVKELFSYTIALALNSLS